MDPPRPEDIEDEEDLESALADFKKLKTPAAPTTTTSTASAGAAPAIDDDMDKMMEEVMAGMGISGDVSIASAPKSGPLPDRQFAATLDALNQSAQTLNDRPAAAGAGAAAGADGWQELAAQMEKMSEPEFQAFVEEMKKAETEGQLGGMMEGMLKQLLTKEILYPAMKDMTVCYPKWVEENRSTLPPADLERYLQQIELVKRICAIYEEERSAEAYYNDVLLLFGQMNELGSPPTEVLKQMAPEAFGPGGLPMFGQGAPCAVM